MSSINALGQVVFQYLQPKKLVPDRPEENAEPVIASDPEGDGNADGQATGDETENPFGAALVLTLQHYGIDSRQFQQHFLSFLTRVTHDRSSASAVNGESSIHINTLG